jgi:hypothetical protein
MARCTAKARSSGWQQCKKLAIKGGTVCATHGGAAPQIKAKAAERVALRAAMAELPERGADEILLSAMHTADAYARWTAAGSDDPDLLIEALTLSARLAKLVLDQEIEAKRSDLFDQVAGAYVAMITRFLDRLDLTPEQIAIVPDALTIELDRMISDGRPPAIEQ